jgi:hypothetical protein
MKNFDFYVHNAEDLKMNFAYDGTFQIHVDNGYCPHYKDFELAFKGYKAMKKIFDITTENRNEL